MPVFTGLPLGPVDTFEIHAFLSFAVHDRVVLGCFENFLSSASLSRCSSVNFPSLLIPSKRFWEESAIPPLRTRADIFREEPQSGFAFHCVGRWFERCGGGGYGAVLACRRAEARKQQWPHTLKAREMLFASLEQEGHRHSVPNSFPCSRMA